MLYEVITVRGAGAGREADADALQPGLADAIAGDLAAIAAAIV